MGSREARFPLLVRDSQDCGTLTLLETRQELLIYLDEFAQEVAKEPLGTDAWDADCCRVSLVGAAAAFQRGADRLPLLAVDVCSTHEVWRAVQEYCRDHNVNFLPRAGVTPHAYVRSLRAERNPGRS
jgi:hypothetical protein